MPRGWSRDTARRMAELAARRLDDPAAAAERARRGAALCRSVLAGEPLPEPAAAALAPPASRVEVVACARCFTPVEGRPGSLCVDCIPERHDLSDRERPDRPP